MHVVSMVICTRLCGTLVHNAISKLVLICLLGAPGVLDTGTAARRSATQQRRYESHPGYQLADNEHRLAVIHFASQPLSGLRILPTQYPRNQRHTCSIQERNLSFTLNSVGVI
jgi:hypothetical protein